MADPSAGAADNRPAAAAARSPITSPTRHTRSVRPNPADRRLHYLPRDIDTIILPYVLLDPIAPLTGQADMLRNLADPVLTDLNTWRRTQLQEARYQVLYERQFSDSNDVFASKYPNYRGDIIWSQAYAAATALMRDAIPLRVFLTVAYLVANDISYFYPNTDIYNARVNDFDSARERIIDDFFGDDADSVIAEVVRTLNTVYNMGIEHYKKSKQIHEDPRYSQLLAREKRKQDIEESIEFVESEDYDTDGDEDDDDAPEQEDDNANGIDYHKYDKQFAQGDRERSRYAEILGHLLPPYPKSDIRYVQRQLITNLGYSLDQRVAKLLVHIILFVPGMSLSDATYSNLSITAFSYISSAHNDRWPEISYVGLRHAVQRSDDMSTLLQYHRHEDSMAIVPEMDEAETIRFLLDKINMIPTTLFFRWDLVNFFEYYVANQTDETARGAFIAKFQPGDLFNIEQQFGNDLLYLLVEEYGFKVFTGASTSSALLLGGIEKYVPNDLLIDSIDMSAYAGPCDFIRRHAYIRPQYVWWNWSGDRTHDRYVVNDYSGTNSYPAVTASDFLDLFTLPAESEASANGLYLLIRTILPCERANDPIYRPFLGFILGSLTASKFTLITMYVLFVKYWYILNRKPTVPYQIIFEKIKDGLHYPNIISDVDNYNTYLFLPVPHPRLIIFDLQYHGGRINFDDTSSYGDEKPQTDNMDGLVQLTPFIFMIPPHERAWCRYFKSTSVIDYDVSDIEWLRRGMRRMAGQ